MGAVDSTVLVEGPNKAGMMLFLCYSNQPPLFFNNCNGFLPLRCFVKVWIWFSLRCELQKDTKQDCQARLIRQEESQARDLQEQELRPANHNVLVSTALYRSL